MQNWYEMILLIWFKWVWRWRLKFVRRILPFLINSINNICLTYRWQPVTEVGGAEGSRRWHMRMNQPAPICQYESCSLLKCRAVRIYFGLWNFLNQWRAKWQCNIMLWKLAPDLLYTCTRAGREYTQHNVDLWNCLLTTTFSCRLRGQFVNWN